MLIPFEALSIQGDHLLRYLESRGPSRGFDCKYQKACSSQFYSNDILSITLQRLSFMLVPSYFDKF